MPSHCQDGGKPHSNNPVYQDLAKPRALVDKIILSKLQQMLYFHHTSTSLTFPIYAQILRAVPVSSPRVRLAGREIQ